MTILEQSGQLKAPKTENPGIGTAMLIGLPIAVTLWAAIVATIIKVAF